jgi:signal transduction histidine kinase
VDRRRLLLDALLWATLAAPIAYARLSPPRERFAAVLLLASLLLLAAAVAGSRRRPLVGLVIVLLCTWFDGNFVFGVPVLSYLAGLRMTRARPAVLVFALVAVVGTVLNLALLGTSMANWFLAATILLFGGVFPWLVGRYRRQQRDLVLAGWRQAEALERERRGADERVRLRERARIAQDMHDSLGHELSLIALRAGALEVAADLDPRHRAAATELRGSVAAATDRLWEIIGVLREDAEPAPTRPADETLTELVAGARDAGMAVRLVVDGAQDPPAAGGPAGPPATLSPLSVGALHRVVQEGLTNAARYAPGAPVVVTLTRTDDLVEVSVVNPRPPAGPLPGPPSTGSGLLALRERVRLAGGTLDAGPRAGGFAVTARLPPAGGVRVDVRVEEPEPDVPPVTRSVDRLHHARRRVRRSLFVAVTAPAVLAGVLSLVYYPFATVNAVLERSAYDRMRIGQPRADLSGLPRRQVGDPSPAPPVPPGASCEYYTDGNFPLARPTYRLCFTEGRLATKDVLNDDEGR